VKFLSSSDTDYFKAVDRDILALQLLETSMVLFSRILKCAQENGIQLTDSSQIELLLAKARNLIQELDSPEIEVLNKRKVTTLYDEEENKQRGNSTAFRLF
jgi:hypothetical protein